VSFLIIATILISTLIIFLKKKKSSDGSASPTGGGTPAGDCELQQVPYFRMHDLNDNTEYINGLRNIHQSPALKVDDDLTELAQKWAQHCLSIKQIIPNKDAKNYSEMIWEYSGPIILDYPNDQHFLRESIDLCYKQAGCYDYSKPGDSQITRHFTALMWKSSQNYGIGVARNDKVYKLYVVMYLNPKGNIGDTEAFRTNVLPPLSPPPPIPGQTYRCLTINGEPKCVLSDDSTKDICNNDWSTECLVGCKQMDLGLCRTHAANNDYWRWSDLYQSAPKVFDSEQQCQADVTCPCGERLLKCNKEKGNCESCSDTSEEGCYKTTPDSCNLSCSMYKK
jgi:hypothetical protein